MGTTDPGPETVGFKVDITFSVTQESYRLRTGLGSDLPVKWSRNKEFGDPEVRNSPREGTFGVHESFPCKSE